MSSINIRKWLRYIKTTKNLHKELFYVTQDEPFKRYEPLAGYKNTGRIRTGSQYIPNPLSEDLREYIIYTFKIRRAAMKRTMGMWSYYFSIVFGKWERSCRRDYMNYQKLLLLTGYELTLNLFDNYFEFWDKKLKGFYEENIIVLNYAKLTEREYKKITRNNRFFVPSLRLTDFFKRYITKKTLYGYIKNYIYFSARQMRFYLSFTLSLYLNDPKHKGALKENGGLHLLENFGILDLGFLFGTKRLSLQDKIFNTASVFPKRRNCFALCGVTALKYYKICKDDVKDVHVTCSKNNLYGDSKRVGFEGVGVINGVKVHNPQINLSCFRVIFHATSGSFRKSCLNQVFYSHTDNPDLYILHPFFAVALLLMHHKALYNQRIKLVDLDRIYNIDLDKVLRLKPPAKSNLKLIHKHVLDELDFFLDLTSHKSNK